MGDAVSRLISAPAAAPVEPDVPEAQFGSRRARVEARAVEHLFGREFPVCRIEGRYPRQVSGKARSRHVEPCSAGSARCFVNLWPHFPGGTGLQRRTAESAWSSTWKASGGTTPFATKRLAAADRRGAREKQRTEALTPHRGGRSRRSRSKPRRSAPVHRRRRRRLRRGFDGAVGRRCRASSPPQPRGRSTRNVQGTGGCHRVLGDPDVASRSAAATCVRRGDRAAVRRRDRVGLPVDARAVNAVAWLDGLRRAGDRRLVFPRASEPGVVFAGAFRAGAGPRSSTTRWIVPTRYQMNGTIALLGG